VASLVAKSADQQVTIYSASVFFQMPNHMPGSTAESLVAALDWLVAENVDVINMSLAGPGNELLEAAIAKLTQLDSTVVVAAVGNNGPSGAPMYPAAYESVIGVTAVDRRNKIFRYANRGEQVAFAARGVDVKVADSLSGGWRIESGTSMASPHIAVVIAQLRRSTAIRPDAVKSWLIANAEDLGRKGFDPVYGHGLITQPPIVVSLN
jgi:subtilisin family serine protease